MPDKFVVLDTGLPSWSGSETLTEKVDALYSHQFQLVESLRYMLRHLDISNFNEDGLKSITDPIAISLREDFNQTEITIDPSGIEAVISGLESTLEMYVKSDVFETTIETLDGDITQLRLDMNGIETRVEDSENNYSSLEQTVNSFSTRIANAEGDASEALQTANSFSTRITTAEGNSSTALQTANGLKTTVTSQGNRISTLEQTSTDIEASVSDLETGMSSTLHLTSTGLRIGSSNGTKTTISGGYITANSITADKLAVGALTASLIKGDTVYIEDSDGYTSGYIQTTDTTLGNGLRIEGESGLKLTSPGNILIRSHVNSGTVYMPEIILQWTDEDDPFSSAITMQGGALILGSQMFGNYLPDNPQYGQIYFLRA